MHPVMLVIEPKEGITGAGVAPVMPSGAELCEQLALMLAKVTERNQLLGWKVTEVTT